MGLYSKVIFPRFYDCLMDKPHLARYRKEQLEPVDGDVLEIGVGTGLNLPHYPEHVRKITTVEPNPGMNRRIAERIRQTGIEVDQRVLGGERLPFTDCTFDCVVSTLTLCSIREVERAVSELYRVLKPGGRFLFLEHGIAGDPGVRRWQRRLSWLQKIIADGCRLDLDVRSVLARQPFRSVEMDTFYMEKTPRIQGYVYRGVATR